MSVELISFLSAVTVALISAIVNLVSMKIQHDKTVAVIDTKLSYTDKELNRLEEKQDKHNGLVERMAVVENNQKTMWNRLDDLERGLHDGN